MITIEEIKNNEALADLNEDQLKAVATLVENNENVVIGEKTRAFWDGVDADIKAVTGEDKPSNMKSYDWLKTTLNGFKETATGSVNQVTTLQERIKELENSIKDNKGDEALRTKVNDLESLAEKLRKDIEAKEIEKQEAIKQAQSENIELRFNNVYANALQGVKFNSNIPELSLEATINAAKAQIASLGKPEFEDGKITFRDDKGEIVRNPKNLQNPLTAKEKFLEILEPIIDKGRQQKGGGSGNTKTDSENYAIGEYKTQAEAVQQIDKYLAAKGLARGTKAFQDEKNTIWKELEAEALPIR